PFLLQAQLVEKFPKSTTNPFGYVILKPSDYSATKSYPVWPFVHGAGGRGDGSSSALDALVSTQIPSNLKAAAEKYKFIIVAPQYADAGNNAVIDNAITKALAIPGADPSRLVGGCFSMGGGEMTRYVTSSQANADKFSLLVVVAGLNGLQSAGIKYIVQSKLPVVYFHANDDPSASVNYSKNGLAAINVLNPEIPAKGVFYTTGGHDITNRVYDADKFPWTGNEIPNNLYEYALSLTNETPAAVPVLPGPVVPVAVASDFSTTTGKIALIGSQSRNYVASKSKWECVGAPTGVNRWNINACSYIDCGLGQVTQLPAEGKYIFRLTVADAAGQTATKDITVTYSTGSTSTEPDPPVPPAKVIVGRFFYGGWELVIYSDGSTDKK
ncbi:MAG: hypothetical protein ACTHMC_12390, partial [Pseudobacter sp.]|uniref:hypothetical protein n=1 Tax=Pseudobacter sp. TaxID=2045420 RepID=UPI003F80A5C6